MKLQLAFDTFNTGSELLIFPIFQKMDSKNVKKSKVKTEEKSLVLNHLPLDVQEAFELALHAKHFKADLGETLTITLLSGQTALLLGMGDKSKIKNETLRKQAAQLFKSVSQKFASATFHFSSLFTKTEVETSFNAFIEGLLLSNYSFDKYLSQKKSIKLKEFFLQVDEKNLKTKLEKTLAEAEKVVSAINFAKDLVNEAPNHQNSEVYAKSIEADAKKLKNVKVKVLNKTDLKKEKMGMFLSVNAGSAYEARLVHLTYTPKKVSAKTKHIALVGKGLTFDTGGYSLKPGASMMGMKFDMAGSATVYAAFRACVELELPVKVSCFLGMTDNAVNSLATMPDSIVTARNGKTVEILNTDAEGRLVLGDVVHYACDFKPNVLIDAATLTGAILIALGSEVCGLFSNDQKLADALLQSAKNTDEYMWQLPIIDEHKNDMKSNVADLKNIGSVGNGGSAKGAAFIQAFLQDDVAWAHLDIAGIANAQSHLPYCDGKNASGLVIRTLVDYVRNV